MLDALPRQVSTALDRAGNVVIAASALMLPVAARAVGAAAGAARSVALPLAERLGLRTTDEATVVRTWPVGVTTPAGAHAAAEADLSAAQATGAVPTAGIGTDDLPIPEWDGLTVAAVGQRLRRLPLDDVRLLLAYEKSHGARPAVLLALERRLARAAGTAPPRTRPATRKTIRSS